MITEEGQIEVHLSEEIQKCHAPVSGYCVACALVTEEGVYFGHNYELENPVRFEHAETNALSKVLMKEDQPKIVRIYMLGGGKVERFKTYMPCFSCANKLKEHIQSDTEIILLPLKPSFNSLKVKFSELLESYEDFPYSKIEALDITQLESEISQKTLLKGKDLTFIAELRLLGLMDIRSSCCLNFTLIKRSLGCDQTRDVRCFWLPFPHDAVY